MDYKIKDWNNHIQGVAESLKEKNDDIFLVKLRNSWIEAGFNTVASEWIRDMFEQKETKEYAMSEFNKVFNMCKSGDVNENISANLMCCAKFMPRKYIQGISYKLVEWGLSHKGLEVLDQTLGIIEYWEDRKDLLKMLASTRLKETWLEEYRKQILDDYKEDLV